VGQVHSKLTKYNLRIRVGQTHSKANTTWEEKKDLASTNEK